MKRVQVIIGFLLLGLVGVVGQPPLTLPYTGTYPPQSQPTSRPVRLVKHVADRTMAWLKALVGMGPSEAVVVTAQDQRPAREVLLQLNPFLAKLVRRVCVSVSVGSGCRGALNDAIGSLTSVHPTALGAAVGGLRLAARLCDRPERHCGAFELC